MTLPVASQSISNVAVTDEAMLDRLRRGDPAAGKELVGRYYQPLLRYLQRLTGAMLLKNCCSRPG